MKHRSAFGVVGLIGILLALSGCWSSHGRVPPIVGDDAGTIVHPPSFPDAGPIDPDEDGDGYPASVDCNDHDPTINPGAVDSPCPDGIDNNCDGIDVGEVPPGIIINCWGPGQDLDGDGYLAGPGPDCNDHDASIHPFAPEFACGLDGVDSNCDGWDYGQACEEDPNCISWLCNG